jgi:hypothetical protein
LTKDKFKGKKFK